MKVYQCFKAIPIVFLLGACTIDVVEDEPETSNSNESLNSATGTASAGSSVGTTSGANGSDAGAGDTPSADGSNASTGNDASTDGTSTLGTNVGTSVGGTNTVTSGDQAGQTGADQSVDQSVDQSNDAQSSTAGETVDTPVQVVMPEPSSAESIVRIPFTDRANAPVIDGATVDYLTRTQLLDGEWRTAAQTDGENKSLGINQYMFGEPGTNNENANHHWAAKHDGVYLYLLVISDDASEHFQDSNEDRKPWKDDSIEIFIDGNHSRLTAYDGVDDFHMTINLFASPDVANSSYISNPKIRKSDTSATLPSDLLFVAGPEKGPIATNVDRGRKDIYEFRIKLSELNIQVGAPFGIEIQINDDDNGGDRDAKWGWKHPEGNSPANDFAWQNPSFMGTAILLR